MKNIFKRNNLLDNGENIDFFNLDTYISAVKWELWANLTRNDVLNWVYVKGNWEKVTIPFCKWNKFSLIYKKQEHIELYANQLLDSIVAWTFIYNDHFSDLLKTYILKWYISILDVKDAIFYKFKLIATAAYFRMTSPLFASIGLNSKKIQVKDYHDIYLDLTKIETLALVYMMKNWHFNAVEFNEFQNIINKSWDDLDYIYSSYYDENLLSNELETMLS